MGDCRDENSGRRENGNKYVDITDEGFIPVWLFLQNKLLEV